MQLNADTLTVKNVDITDHRNKPAEVPDKPQEQPKRPNQKTVKEKTDEEREKLKASADIVHNRMFPKEEKPPAKGADKTKTETATAPNKDGKTEKATDRPKAEKKEPADDGGGKPGAKVETTDADPKPKLKPVKKEDPAPSIDYEKMGTTVATAVAKVLKPEEKTTQTAADDIDPTRRRILPAIEHLEKTNPKYKGKVEEYKKFAKEEAEYVAKWQKDNPGEKFDPDGDEHNAFYDKHEPDIAPEDIDDALVEVRARTIAAEEINPKIAKLELERDVERAERDLPRLASRNVGIVATEFGEDAVKAMAEMKEGQKLEDIDPAAHNTLVAIMPELNERTRAAVKIFGTDGRAYDPNDADHVAVAQSALELQNLLLAEGEAKLTQPDGRKYATLDQWAGMTREQRAKHWTITADLMAAHLANNAAKKAGEIYKSEREKAEKLAAAYGYVKPGATETARTTQTQEREETEAEHGKTRSPSTSTRAVIQPGAKVDPKTAKDGGDLMLGRMFGR